MWMGKFCSSLLWDNVSIPQDLLFGSNTGLWAISASLHQARVSSTVLLETESFLPVPGQGCPGQMNRVRPLGGTIETMLRLKKIALLFQIRFLEKVSCP